MPLHRSLAALAIESAMEDPRKLHELAAWYREFAEQADNPEIWHARLMTAEHLEREADRLEKIAARSDVPARQGDPVRAKS